MTYLFMIKKIIKIKIDL